MLSKKDLKGHEFETMDQYFEYIIDSKINGQNKQVTNLIKKLSKDQILEFSQWVSSNQPDILAIQYKTLIIEILCS
jgi:hypothetical protein